MLIIRGVIASNCGMQAASLLNHANLATHTAKFTEKFLAVCAQVEAMPRGPADETVPIAVDHVKGLKELVQRIMDATDVFVPLNEGVVGV